jgi:hypothetical protein
MEHLVLMIHFVGLGTQHTLGKVREIVAVTGDELNVLPSRRCPILALLRVYDV